MIIVIFTVFAMGVGVGMGTVLSKYLMVKDVSENGIHIFKWNSKKYTVFKTSEY